MFTVDENVLSMQFSYKSPNKTWISYITYIPNDEVWIYLVGIKDCYTKEIVEFYFSDAMTSNLVIRALEKACARHRPDSGLLLHSDVGFQKNFSWKFKELTSPHP